MSSNCTPTGHPIINSFGSTSEKRPEKRSSTTDSAEIREAKRCCSSMGFPSSAASPNGSAAALDANLYSRQIGAFGLETMQSLIKMKVLISGLRGVGVESAKNLILAGPARVTLHDEGVVEARDLGANFYLQMSHVGKISRAAAVVSQLAELNDYVAVDVHNGPITEDMLKQFDVVLMSNASRAELIRVNSFCRRQSPPIGFIFADSFGLSAALFTDFGDCFTINDKDGEEPRSAIVAGITTGSPASVHIHEEKPMPFQDGDYVTFHEVGGMTELNESPPRMIKICGKHSFSIDDTSSYTPYTAGGIVVQAKVPTTMQFQSFEQSCLKPLPPNESMLLTADLGKFGRPEQLHLAVQAILFYRDKHGRLPSARCSQAVEECFEFAKDWNERSKEVTSGSCPVDEVSKEVIQNVVFFASCSLSPVASFVGGIAAQEVVKYTRKFTPMHQWFYIDFFEALPGKTAVVDDWNPRNSRYDDQLAIWGAKFQESMSNLRFFLVGAGALGCEFLKEFSLMGIGCGDRGNITVTDMDNIETSNLNRQFLFRRRHVGQSKSIVASEAAKEINEKLNLIALNDRVGQETEEKFNDEFWHNLDMVVNALDNVPSRLYIDSRCVWYAKPLMESGTLGTKANVQVVLPNKTESYGDSQDPPEESIPLCTLKHFPHAIEHTIEWSRDVFQGIFTDGPQQVVTYFKDSAGYFSRLQNEGAAPMQREKLEKIRDLLALRQRECETSSVAFARCVERAVLLFHEFFFLQIHQLLHNFPLEHVTSEGLPFWNGPKRPPSPILFDVNDPLHFEFVKSAAILFAEALGVPTEENIAAIAKAVSLPRFTPRKVCIQTDENAANQGLDSAADDDLVVRQLTAELRKTVTENDTKGSSIRPIEFEKDDDTNFHIAFISSCANLRARNYKISECDHLKVKMIAGKIIPAIATTTAMVTGLVGIEILKAITHNERTVEDFRNAFVNLSLPIFLLSEPLPPAKTTDKDYDPIACGPIRARPPGFTTWDKIEVSISNGTLKDFIDAVESKMNVDIAIVSVGNICLYNSFLPTHKSRLQEPIQGLYEKTSKLELPLNRRYLACEMSCSDKKDQVDVIIPVVKCLF